ncbi:MAG: HAMP domain-containing sensor histidine kinase, partial [Burkholderiales bacterium]
MWLITGGLLLALLAGLLMVGFYTRPLRRLGGAMKNFSHHDFCETHLPQELAARPDEIGRVVETFNQMALRIKEQMCTLEQNDQERREMLANVSHDLRTPLASLQGYLETLLMKEQSLSQEEKRNYLEIAAKQSVRLSKLVGKLFELAKLDSARAKLAPEPFLLPELVQDVVQKFELAAAKKQIALKTNFPGVPPLVRADIGLIERVLENLIENALHYTPSGGSISVTLTPSLRQVTLEVSDTGRGIEAQDLERIFERFFRAEKSRHDASDSAGLGLAIVKRILELHQSQIKVQSTPGQGTTFSFPLPLVHTA